MKKREGLSTTLDRWAQWGVVGLMFLLFGVVALFVDLQPVVDENFFFSTSDPQLRQTKEIQEQFSTEAQLLLNVAAPDIFAKQYLRGIRRLTREVRGVEGVTGVISVTSGPKTLAAALASPFWRRLLISEDRDSSNLILQMQSRDTGGLIRRLEAIVKEYDQEYFRIRIAGPPYVVEMIRRSLVHDFLFFSLAAVFLFGLVMAGMFRSLRVFFGMLVTCINAVLVTLLLQDLLGKKIGILTVNLGTIVFVVTLSHLVYMTFNWQTLAGRTSEQGHALVTAARRMTFPASFWSMVCAALGFGSLLIVQAKPLRELGFGGLLGSGVAFVCAYAMYPWFLSRAVPRNSKIAETAPSHEFWSRRFLWPSIVVIVVGLALGFGLPRVNTDPSLLDYFKAHRPLRDGLEYVDRIGGCNPLTLVVRASDASKLNTPEAYKKLWTLQRALEKQPDVGTVISLPVLLAEGKRRPFAFLFSEETMLRLMEQPELGEIAETFINKERTEVAFFLLMKESARKKLRLAVVDDLREVVREHGFEPTLVGGIYDLQGELAKLVAESLVTGLFWLSVLFTLIAWVVARSIRGAVAMIVSLMLVPLTMLGGIGLLRVPMDVISSPATNICIGIAIDSMIHLMFGVRRAQKAGKKGWAAWVAGREEQWRGIVYSDVIIAAGFAIFVLSDFPPTQRFGLVVLAGTIVDIIANLLVLPLLGGATSKKS